MEHWEPQNGKQKFEVQMLPKGENTLKHSYIICSSNCFSTWDFLKSHVLFNPTFLQCAFENHTKQDSKSTMGYVSPHVKLILLESSAHFLPNTSGNMTTFLLFCSLFLRSKKNKQKSKQMGRKKLWLQNSKSLIWFYNPVYGLRYESGTDLIHPNSHLAQSVILIFRISRQAFKDAHS